MRVVDEAVFRYDEVTRLSDELVAAIKDWQGWVKALSVAEFATYHWRLEHRDQQAEK